MKHRRATFEVAEGHSLGGVASRALTWSFLNTAVSRLGTLAVGIVLARLLGPEEFGTYAVALVALAGVLSFNELGVSLAIVRWPGAPEEIAPTVATVSVVASTILTVCAYLCAPAFAEAMGDPGAAGIVQLMTVCILVSGIVATPAALMQREFMQRRRMWVDQINVWVGAGLSIALALAGLGALSLAIGRVVATILSAALFLIYSPQRIRFGFDRSKARQLLRFGLPLAGSSIIVFAVGYADQIVVGSMLGTTALGYYVLAFNLASWPVNMFSQPLRSVAPAAFSRLQHDQDAMQGSLRSVVGLLGALTLPICFLLAGAAAPIVAFVYGQQWLPAAAVLSWLAVLAAFRILFELAYDYLVVIGRSRGILIIQVVWLIFLIPGLVAGAAIDGLGGLAAVQVLIAAALIVPLYAWELHATGMSVSALGRRLWVPLIGGAIVGVGAWLIARSVSTPFWACLLAGVLCAATILLLLYRDRTQLKEARDLADRGTRGSHGGPMHPASFDESPKARTTNETQ